MLVMTGQGGDGTPYLYAVDKRTGERLGSVQMPGPSRYGMMTYMHEGTQYIAVPIENPGSLAVFKLPGAGTGGN
jgi:quinoprotein glucose dehydrogenase